MKKLLIAGLMTVIAFIMTSFANAQAPKMGAAFVFGYRAVPTDGTTYSHDTHPDDWFLPNSSVPGSAGTTGFDKGVLHFAEFGLNGNIPLSERISFGASFGGLVGGTRNEHKNWNDSRPDANGAFVYTKARFGMFADISMTYHPNDWFFTGVQGALTVVFIDSGWDRYGLDESTKTKTSIAPSVGPVIGFVLSDNSCIRFSVEAAKNNVVGSMTFNIGF